MSTSSCVSLLQAVLPAFGGKLVTDPEATWWVTKAGDFQLEAEPFIRTHSEGTTFVLECAVGHPEFGRVANRIAGSPPEDLFCIKWFSLQEDLTSDRPAISCLETLMKRGLHDAASEPLSSYVSRLLASRPDRPFLVQVAHLAALAWSGDFSTLLSYEAAFERGYRLNFVPLITVETIRRAMSETREAAGAT